VKPLRFTLIGDGPSDKALVPAIDWILVQNPQLTARGYTLQFTARRDLGALDLQSNVRKAVETFRCDAVFVHRDAEGAAPEHRVEEIRRAVTEVTDVPFIPVVPVHMTEAWLLLDEPAIRRAVDNPSGRARLNLPRAAAIERLADPKSLLNERMLIASEATGRRRKKISRPTELAQRRLRVAQLVEDYARLRVLPAFLRLERDTSDMLQSLL